MISKILHSGNEIYAVISGRITGLAYGVKDYQSNKRDKGSPKEAAPLQKVSHRLKYLRQNPQDSYCTESSLNENRLDSAQNPPEVFERRPISIST